MPRSHGRVSRAASALLFCAAALAALVFPDGSAEEGGITPAQVPFDLLLIPGEDARGVDPADPRFDGGELCEDLGGELRNASGEQVCSRIDINDTFCIPGSAEAFPCRGLYKHVIVCNAGYNRRALNPFFCGEKCADGLRARGANCERVVLLDEREVLAYVSPTYTGSVAFFRAREGATLRTPSSAPAGFAFATDTEFAAPAGVVVSMASSLHDGGYRTGDFVVTAEGLGVSQEITLRVNVNALNRLNSSWGGLAGDSGRLKRLSVPGFSGAQFFRDSSSEDSQLTLSIDGEVGAPAPLMMSVGTPSSPSYELELSGHAKHDGFLGRLPFRLTGEVCTVPETLTDFSAEGQITMEAVVREYSLNGDPDLRQLACETVYMGGSPSAALHPFANANRPRALGLLLELNADVNNYLFESGTALDIALEIGALSNTPVLRRAGGGCVLYEGHRGAECASEHSDYAGLPQVPASSIVAPELRNVTITLGQLSPTQVGWRSTVALMTVSSAANFPDPARRVLLRPLGSDSGRVRGETKRVRNLRKTTGREVVLTPFYPGAGGVFRDFFHVQGVQNGKRPGRATIALTYEALPNFRMKIQDTTPGASFFDLRSFPELSDAELFELDDDPGLDNIVASTPGFSVAANGMVSGPDDFSDPATVFFLARSSNFAGWAHGRLDINSQVVAQDHDLLIAERNPRLTVLTGYTGVVYPFQTYRLFELGYDLLFEETGAVFADGGLERVWANLLIPEGRPMTLGETRTAEMTVGVDCAVCALDEKLTVTAVFVPLELSAPAQGRFTVTINQPEPYFKFPLNLPPGYGPNEGATTYVEDSGHTNIFNAHRESGFLSYQCAPAIKGCDLVGWPFPGTYVVPVIFENESLFVGRLTLSVTVQVVGQPLGDLGIPESELRTTVWVHPGFSGAVHRVTTASAETFLNCGLRVYPAGFQQTYDCEFILTPGVGDRSVTVVLEESRLWFATRTVTAELHVKELSPPPVARISGAAPIFASVVVHDFASDDYAGGVYAGAEFSERPPSSALGARQNGEIYAKETLLEERYGLTVLAAHSPGFRGSVLLTVELDLAPPPPSQRILAADSIPLSERHIIVQVPFDDGALTLWKAKARNSSVMMSVVRRVNNRDFFNIADPGADIVGGDTGVLTYNRAANEIRWDPDNDKVGGGLDFAFWARAERPGYEWIADEFIVRIQLSDLEKVPARNAAFDRAKAAGRVLTTLFPPGFSDATITESSDAGNLFTVSPDGEARLSGVGAPTAGLRTLIARARDDAGERGYKRFHGDILLTARIRFLNAGEVAFAADTVSEGGGGVSVSAPDRHGRAVALGAAYRGVRRGLHWMESTAGVSRLDVYSPDQRGRHEQFCAAGGEMNGKRWRVPTVGEVAGVLTAGDGPAVLMENNRIWQIPGAASGMAIPLPSAPRGGENNLEGEAFVVAGWERNAGGQAAPIIYDGGGTETTLGGHFHLSETIGSDGEACKGVGGAPVGYEVIGSGTETNAPCAPVGVNPRLVCVLEKGSYSPVPPLLGVRLEGGGRVLAGGAAASRTPAVPELARTDLPEIFERSGPVLTVTASAWRTAATPSFRAAARDVADAPLTGAFSGSAGLVADFSSSEGKTLAVVRLTETPTFALEMRVFTLSFAPEFGATVSLAVTMRSQAPPVSDAELAAALPPEFRGGVFRAAEGYSGALLTLSSSVSGVDLLLPTGGLDDGFGIAKTDAKHVLTVSEIADSADSRAVDIAATVSVVGRNSRRTATLSFSVEPLPSPLPEPVFLPVNRVGLFPFAQLKAGDFASAVFERISGDAGLRVDAQSGAVSAEAREWAEGGYHLVVGARDAGRFFGQARITVSLVMGTIKPILFQFDQRDVREPGDMVAVENLPGDARFLMTYRGIRRGLHWMESAAAGSSGDQRILCGRGGQGAWRVPTPSEVAGLLLPGDTAEIGGSVPAENGAGVGAQISLAAGATDTLDGLSAGPFFADFLLSGRPVAARAEGGKLHLSGAGAARYLCVSAAAGAAYEIPERLVGVRAEAAGDSQSGGGVFSFRHGRIGSGEIYRISVFAYNAPLAGLRDNGAASLRVEILEDGNYTTRYESDAGAPGAGVVILASPGAVAAGETLMTVRITPSRGAAVAWQIAAVAESTGERPVAAEDSIPLSERFVIAQVPTSPGRLTLWEAKAKDSDVDLALVSRVARVLTSIAESGNTEFFYGEKPSYFFQPSGDGLPAAHAVNVDGSVENPKLTYDSGNTAVVWSGGSGREKLPGLEFLFRVRATHSDALEWDPDEFDMRMRFLATPDEPVQNFARVAQSAAGKVLTTLALSGFSGATLLRFEEVADGGNLFAVSADGEVSLSGSGDPAAGEYQLVAAVSDEDDSRGYKRFYGRISITANIAFLSSGGVAFAGHNLAAEGATVSVVLTDAYDIALHTDNAVYRGERRGLHWVETAATLNRARLFSSRMNGFAEQFCDIGGESGGNRWRVPTVGEVAGILTNGAGPVFLAENNRFREIPGAASGMRISLPTAERGGAKNLSGDAFVVSLRDRNGGGKAVPVIYELTGGQAKLGGNDAETVCPGSGTVPAGYRRTTCGAKQCIQSCTPTGLGPRYVCVLDAGSSSLLPPLLGARIEENGRELAGGMVPLRDKAPKIPDLATAEAGPLTVQGAVLTISAVGWNYGVGSQFRVFPVDYPSAAISMTATAPDGFESGNQRVAAGRSAGDCPREF